jgi:hypothetical protein
VLRLLRGWSEEHREQCAGNDAAVNSKSVLVDQPLLHQEWMMRPSSAAGVRDAYQSVEYTIDGQTL